MQKMEKFFDKDVDKIKKVCYNTMDKNDDEDLEEQKSHRERAIGESA